MVDYEKVDKLVENCKQLYPDMPDYVLWVLACDYYINEENDEDDEDEELKTKREQLKKEMINESRKSRGKQIDFVKLSATTFRTKK